MGFLTLFSKFVAWIAIEHAAIMSWFGTHPFQIGSDNHADRRIKRSEWVKATKPHVRKRVEGIASHVDYPLLREDVLTNCINITIVDIKSTDFYRHRTPHPGLLCVIAVFVDGLKSLIDAMSTDSPVYPLLEDSLATP
jgi:hypothetical protein